MFGESLRLKLPDLLDSNVTFEVDSWSMTFEDYFTWINIIDYIFRYQVFSKEKRKYLIFLPSIRYPITRSYFQCFDQLKVNFSYLSEKSRKILRIIRKCFDTGLWIAWICIIILVRLDFAVGFFAFFIALLVLKIADYCMVFMSVDLVLCNFRIFANCTCLYYYFYSIMNEIYFRCTRYVESNSMSPFHFINFYLLFLSCIHFYLVSAD